MMNASCFNWSQFISIYPTNTVLPVNCSTSLYSLWTPFAHVLFSQQAVATNKDFFLGRWFVCQISILHLRMWKLECYTFLGKLYRGVFHSVQIVNYKCAALSQKCPRHIVFSRKLIRWLAPRVNSPFFSSIYSELTAQLKNGFWP